LAVFLVAFFAAGFFAVFFAIRISPFRVVHRASRRAAAAPVPDGTIDAGPARPIRPARGAAPSGNHDNVGGFATPKSRQVTRTVVPFLDRQERSQEVG
jgi:hypothetical protein